MFQLQESKRQGDPKPLNPAEIVSHQNGIYYFSEKFFADSLLKFLEWHPDKKIGAIISDNKGSYARDKGYFVYFKNKQKE